MEFPLNAQVQCTDGSFGHSTTVIVDPATETIAYVAVRDPDREQTEYLVPVDMVESTSAEAIHLRCTCDEVAGMEPFIETDYVQVMASYMDPLGYETTPEIVLVEKELVPEGTRAVHPGMLVEASDDYVGTIQDLIVEPESLKVTHFVLRMGHGMDVAIPVSAIERRDNDTIYLALDRESIEAMPAYQIRRHYHKKEIDKLAVELVTVVFDGVDRAEEAVKALKPLIKEGQIELRNTAVVAKEEDGSISAKEAADLGAGGGALFGAITGGLIGLLGGPIGAVVGAAAGAATGSVAASAIDRGFSDAYLEQVEERLQPGTSALITLVEQASIEEASKALADLQGHVVRLEVSGESVTGFAAEEDNVQSGERA